MNGVYQYSLKKDFKSSELDKYVIGMRGAVNVLPTGANIAFSAVGVPKEMQSQIRYLLAPRLLSFANIEQYDTVLTVSALNKKDSLIQSFALNGNTVIWQNQDTSYCYILSSKHK
jgi:hypothetical protein